MLSKEIIYLLCIYYTFRIIMRNLYSDINSNLKSNQLMYFNEMGRKLCDIFYRNDKNDFHT